MYTKIHGNENIKISKIQNKDRISVASFSVCLRLQDGMVEIFLALILLFKNIVSKHHLS
jgi:hypothetical protein